MISILGIRYFLIYLTCSDTEKKNSNEKMREFLFLPSVACASFFKYMYFLPGLLIPFTLFFLFFFSAGSKKHYALFNLTHACIMFGGQCKNKCGENEFRMVYCVVSTSLCCIRQCKPKTYK